MTRMAKKIVRRAVLSLFILALPLSLFAASHKTNVNKEIGSLKHQIYVLNKRINHMGSGACCKDSGYPYGDPNNQSSPFCFTGGCQTNDNPVLYVRRNFPYFYDVVTKNGPKSTADNDYCIKGKLCFSGLANLDLLYADRRDFGLFPGRAYGVGTRPQFGEEYDINVYGGINDLDLFVDGAINNWVTAHMDFAYVNAQRKVNTYSHEARDWGSVYRDAAALKVNEAYLLFANPACTPLYIQIGRFNSPFGHYDPYPLVQPLTQLISQMRTGGVILGAAFQNGLYGSVFWTMSQQSSDNLLGRVSFFSTDNKDRNYGAQIGYKGCVSGLHFDLDVDYVADILDADYILEAYEFYNVVLRTLPPYAFLLGDQYVRACRADGISLHADLQYCMFGLRANYVKALAGLNPDPNVQSSKICAYDITGVVNFCVANCPAVFEISYQDADDADVYETFRGPLPPPQFGFVPLPLRLGNILPSERYTASIGVNVMHNVAIYLKWVHDCDFCEDPYSGGTGRSSNFGLARISAQF